MTESGSPNFLAALGLDTRLFLAQLLNFSIILFVMWKFVYKRLLTALDERTKKISKGLADADEARALKLNTEAEKQQMLHVARKEAQGIIDDARAVAITAHDAIMKTTKLEVEKVVAQGREEILADKNVALRSAKAELGDIVVAAVEKIAREKIDPQKDAKLLQELLQ